MQAQLEAQEPGFSVDHAFEGGCKWHPFIDAMGTQAMALEWWVQVVRGGVVLPVLRHIEALV